jgi:hypothetical protein
VGRTADAGAEVCPLGLRLHMPQLMLRTFALVVAIESRSGSEMNADHRPIELLLFDFPPERYMADSFGFSKISRNCSSAEANKPNLITHQYGTRAPHTHPD